MLFGIDVLMLKKSFLIENISIALATTNFTRDSKGVKTVDHFINQSINLKFLLQPSFGFYITDESHNDLDYQGVKTFSFFDSEFEKNIKKIKMIVFDMQGIGISQSEYTFILFRLMRYINDLDIKLLVLDRPNPIDASTVSGIYNCNNEVPGLPLRHGLTMAEMAEFFKKEYFINTDLMTIGMEGYDRGCYLDDVYDVFEKNYPGLESFDSILLYAGVHLLETTNLAIIDHGVDSYTGFGAPWIDEEMLMDSIIELGLEGFSMRTAVFEPISGYYKGKRCNGIKFTIEDKNLFDPVELFLNIIELCYSYYAEFVLIKDGNGIFELDNYFGDERIRKAVERYIPVTNVYFHSMATVEEYLKKRENILMYKN